MPPLPRRQALTATLAQLLTPQPGGATPPRVVMSHEHRKRPDDAPVQRWTDHDETLERFAEAAAAQGLLLEWLGSDAAGLGSIIVDGVSHLSSEISIFEVKASR